MFLIGFCQILARSYATNNSSFGGKKEPKASQTGAKIVAKSGPGGALRRSGGPLAGEGEEGSIFRSKMEPKGTKKGANMERK